jgi:hypothetical protein
VSNAGEPKALQFGKALSNPFFFPALRLCWCCCCTYTYPSQILCLSSVMLFLFWETHIYHVKFSDFFSWFCVRDLLLREAVSSCKRRTILYQCDRSSMLCIEMKDDVVSFAMF